MNSRIVHIVLTFISLVVAGLRAQGTSDEAIRALDKLVKTERSPFLKGYQNSVSGETIVYHSANEYVNNALLARTTDGKSQIVWVTENVPRVVKDSFPTFVWLAGIAGSKGVHKFHVFIDEEERFSFSSAPDSSRKVWEISGKAGETLTFVVTKVDQFQDLFGYMFLRMPARLLRKGLPLTIRVVGAAEENSAWYMTFQHALEQKIRIKPLPLLVQKGNSVCQLIKIGIERYSSPITATVYTDAAQRINLPLRWGIATCTLPVDSVSRDTQLNVTVESRGKVLHRELITVKPVRRRTFYLLPHSHTDIGYSDYQAVIEQNHIRYVDEAIALAQKTSSYPVGARFKWNIEVLWPLESYVKKATENQRIRLGNAIKNGWIGLNGLYANILTGLCRPEELIHATDYARTLEKEFGVAVHSAMITDIPAYTSSTVTALGLAGMRYFSSGPNYLPTTEDGGDRIGYALKAWGDKPFYWQSQSGQQKVLFWMAGRGYSWFHGLNMGRLRTASLATICDYLDELDRKSYPYEIVQVRYTVGGDNGPPDPDLSDCVQEWNKQYLSPKMVIATTEELFEEFERRYANELPTYSGDFTPYWEDGAVSTAREVVMNRKTADRLVQAEALTAICNPLLFEPTTFYSAWRNVVLFDEHTWGAANSVSEPDSPNVKAQWEYKKAFVLNGDSLSNALMDKVENRSTISNGELSIDIINTNSWPRTDLVVIPPRLSTGKDVVRDSHNERVLSQRLTTGELAVLVHDVPPFGATRLVLSPGDNAPVARDIQIGKSTLSNSGIALTVDEKTGSINSLVWNHTQLVDTSTGSGLNQYFYVPGRDPRTSLTDLLTYVSVKERGPLVASLVVVSSPPGCNSFTREIRIISGLERVDVIDSIDKKAIREKESVHLGFPFLVPEGKIIMDGGWETVRPELDQLTGSCKDFFSVQRWVDVSNNSHGVTWANPDAPLVEIGSVTNEALSSSGHRIWRTSVTPSQNIYSYAMNNYWHTNYRADQDGITVLRYSILPHNTFEYANAERFGIERSQPLLVRPAADSLILEAPLLSIDPVSVIVTQCKPSDDHKGFVVRLYNANDATVAAKLHWNATRGAALYKSSVYEEKGEPVSSTITLPGFGVATLRIE